MYHIFGFYKFKKLKKLSKYKEVLNNLPMEFAVEAQKLLEISLEGSVG